MDKPVQHQAITLPEPMSPRGSYSSPGYYVIDQTGNPVSDRYDSQSLAFANLNGGAGVQYLDQPTPGHLNQPWPPELHTVVGHTEGGQMSYTEADLLRAMASTNDLNEQRYLMSALEEVRRDAHQATAAVQAVDFAPPHHVGEERPYHPYHSGAFGSSSATDWLAEMGASDDGMQEHMLTMGSRFFIGCHPEVKADPVEYMTQALGVARVAASQFNDIEGAVNIFMGHVANLNRVDMTKIGVDQLLPWEAPPEQLPPVSTDEYSGPYSKNLNEEVNDEPSQDGRGLPGLDNGESGRAVMGGLSILSSHPHMSEFLFEGPTPEELAAASGPNNLNKNPNISGSQDATPEPNDDGALSGSMRGDAPILAHRKTAADDDDGGDHYKYIHHRPGHKDAEGNEAPWVVTQKGTGKVLSSHGSESEAQDSFKAMMRSKSMHGGARGGNGRFQTEESDRSYDEEGRRDAEEAAETDKYQQKKKEGSRAQAPQQMTYEEYLARLSPGGYPVAREFYSGAMAAHAPSENDPTVPEWGKRQGPKASVTERPAPYRGVTTRIAGVGPYDTPAPEDLTPREGTLQHLVEGHSHQMKLGGSDYQMEDPEALHWYLHKVWDDPRASTHAYRNTHTHEAHTAANEDMLNPQAFERAVEDDAPALRPQPSGTYDPETAHGQSGEAAHDITGLIPQGDLAEPYSNISDFPETSVGERSAAAEGGMMQFGPHHERMVAGEGAYLRNPHNSGHKVYVEPGHEVTRGQKYQLMWPPGTQYDYDSPEHGKGWHLGGNWGPPQPKPEPDANQLRLFGAKPEDYGPQGKHETNQSSTGWINWDFNNTGSDLGMPPVEGYMRDADNPNGEMWPWETPPIGPGQPPRGAADVADVPTPGAGVGYPQPNVTKNSTLDAWRANIAARTAAGTSGGPKRYRGDEWHRARRGIIGPASPEDTEDVQRSMMSDWDLHHTRDGRLLYDSGEPADGAFYVTKHGPGHFSIRSDTGEHHFGPGVERE